MSQLYRLGLVETRMTSGNYYTRKSINDVLEKIYAKNPQHIFFAELGFPAVNTLHGRLSQSQYMDRITTIDHSRVVASITGVHVRGNDIIGAVKFHDVYRGLENMLDDSGDFGFGLRSFTYDYVKRGETFKDIRDLITFDFVPSPSCFPLLEMSGIPQEKNEEIQ